MAKKHVTYPAADPTSKRHYALKYIEMGWAILPLHHITANGNCSCGSAECKSPGKHPLFSNGVNGASNDLQLAERIWRRFPDANIGVATGKASNIVVLDIDGPEGEATITELEALHTKLPSTLTQLTGKGHHLIFQAPEAPVKSRTNLHHQGSKLDSRGEGGYIVVAPSTHYSGKQYMWKDVSAPVAPMPNWLVETINGSRGKSMIDVGARDGTIKEGGRNATLASLAGSMRRKGMSESAILQALLAENDARCNPPLDASEVRTIAASISRYEAANDANALYQTLNDTGNAERFVEMFGAKYRFVVGHNRWIVWEDSRWRYDETNTVVESAKAVAKGIFREAAECRSDDAAKALASHAKKTMQRQSIIAMLELAKSHPCLAISPTHLDADPMLLGVANGVLDLKSGQLLPNDPSHLILRYSAVAYDPAASCPQFMQFLAMVTNEDQERIAYLQRVAGYCLTGQTSEQCLFFLYGKGGNGKSTFAGILSTLMGDYARQAPSDMLAQRSGNRGPSNDLARLKGARILISAEVEEGSFLAETLVKELTGGDTIAARFLYGEYFEFRPCFKILMSGNHKPVVRGEDEGIWRRIRLVPFDVTIPPERRDKHLMAKLHSELPGILKWAVEGTLAWQHDGLGTPSIVQKAVDNYRSEMDIFGSWLDEKVEAESDYSERANKLYACYQQWCVVNGHRCLSSTAFGRKLSERFDKARDNVGYFYRGLRIKPIGDKVGG